MAGVAITLKLEGSKEIELLRCGSDLRTASRLLPAWRRVHGPPLAAGRAPATGLPAAPGRQDDRRDPRPSCSSAGRAYRSRRSRGTLSSSMPIHQTRVAVASGTICAPSARASRRSPSSSAFAGDQTICPAFKARLRPAQDPPVSTTASSTSRHDRILILAAPQAIQGVNTGHPSRHATDAHLPTYGTQNGTR